MTGVSKHTVQKAATESAATFTSANSSVADFAAASSSVVHREVYSYGNGLECEATDVKGEDGEATDTVVIYDKQL